MKKAILTGVTGQINSFMADYLLANTDIEIYGMVRRLSVDNHKNIRHLENNARFHLISGDLIDGHSLSDCIEQVKPDYYIHAAAQSSVSESWNSPINTFETDAVAIIHILEAIRKIVPHCKFINMGSSQVFGDVQYSPQDVNHPFRSQSPYAAAKVAAHQIIKSYREYYNLYALTAICYNMEGTRRGMDFVSRKITRGVAKIYHSIKNGEWEFAPIELGNYDSERDWSDAEDIVDGVWRMLNQEVYNKDFFKNRFQRGYKLYNGYFYEPYNREFVVKNIKEYILSSQNCHPVREFVEKSFKEANIEGQWYNWGKNPKDEIYALGDGRGLLTKKLVPLVKINPKFYRLNEVVFSRGDSSPIRKELGWLPKVGFDELVRKMVKNDIENFNK